jgi:phytoene dehydrogenase-like protein
MPNNKTDLSSPAPEKKYDVIIIGGGIGGLTAATILAKCHLSVCVVEMAPHPGGYLTRFKRNGFSFDSAIHWLNQMGEGGFVKRVFDLIGPDAPKTPENKRIRRFLSDSYDFILTNDPNEMRDAMIAKQPDEEKAISKFFRASKATADAFTKMTNHARTSETMSFGEKTHSFLKSSRAAIPLIRYLPFSAKTGLRRFFKSSCLQQLYRTEEKLLSCMVPVGWAYNNDYQLPPKGGSQALTDWLSDTLKSWDADIICNSRVHKINMKDGMATGVNYNFKGEEKTIHGTYIIAACDVESVYSKLLPEGTLSERIIRKQKDAAVYNSCVTVTLGLDCPTQALGVLEEQVLIREGNVTRKEQDGGDPDKTEISVIATSSRDASVAPKGKGVLIIYASCTIDYGNYWEAERDNDGNFTRGDAYKAFKKNYANALIKRVEEKLIPDLRSHIEVTDIATPLTYLRYTGNRNGAIMGFRPTYKNIKNKVAHISTPVSNLFIGGQWAALGGGVPIAVKAGVNSALLVIRKEKPEAFKILVDVIDGKKKAEKQSTDILR